METRNNERTVKLVMLGEHAVGKTSIASRFVKGIFTVNSYPTIGAAYMTKKIKINDNKYMYELWDCAGQERYRAITPLYYRNTQSALIVFDISNPSSFETVLYWFGQLKAELDIENIPIVLVANKCDLIDELNNQNEYETIEILKTAENFAKENGLGFFKASAKTGKGITEIFKYLALNLPTKDELANENIDSERTTIDPVRLNRVEYMEKKVRDACCQ
jgi:Ras-related protein Rab-5C